MGWGPHELPAPPPWRKSAPSLRDPAPLARCRVARRRICPACPSSSLLTAGQWRSDQTRHLFLNRPLVSREPIGSPELPYPTIRLGRVHVNIRIRYVRITCPPRKCATPVFPTTDDTCGFWSRTRGSPPNSRENFRRPSPRDAEGICGARGESVGTVSRSQAIFCACSPSPSSITAARRRRATSSTRASRSASRRSGGR